MFQSLRYQPLGDGLKAINAAGIPHGDYPELDDGFGMTLVRKDSSLSPCDEESQVSFLESS